MNNEDKILCPVMKNPVDVEKAMEAGLTSEYNGKVFYFCCPGCKPKFEEDPEKYLSDSPEREDGVASHGCCGNC